jgi:hypothetical protein
MELGAAGATVTLKCVTKATHGVFTMTLPTVT